MKKITDFNFGGKRVLVRCDFNVPLSPEGKISDDFRIKKTLPTIKYLIKKKAKVILISHLGRPKGRQEKYSLKPVAKKLERLLKKKVKFLPDCVGPEVEKEIEKMKEKDIILLENLRFHKEGEGNDENFARKLSKLGDIFINDAFSASHRAHASIVGIPKFLISGAGFLLEKEVKVLSQIIENPKRPLVVIIGGSKVGDKAKVAENFSEIGDWLLVGSLIAEEIKGKKMKIKNLEKIIWPVDESGLGKDIGPQTIELFKDKILLAKTIFWAGPLGKIEEEKYQKGTKEIARAVIESGALSVVGGGDTIEFLNKIGLLEKFNHVSTGGGAMLEFLSGEKLPGIETLKGKWKLKI